MQRVSRLVFLSACTAAMCTASIVTYSGADVGNAQTVGTNSLAAFNSFTSVVAVSQTYTLESIALGTINGSLGTGLTAACGNCVSTLSGVTNNNTNEWGYNTTSGGSVFYRVEGPFSGSSVLTLTFTDSINAFGAYITGIQDFLGTTVVTFNDGAPQQFTLLNTGTTLGSPAGSQFFGFTTTGVVSSITFTTTNSASSRDIWGIDDILIQATIPEPGTVGLVGLGLIGLAFLRRRR